MILWYVSRTFLKPKMMNDQHGHSNMNNQNTEWKTDEGQMKNQINFFIWIYWKPCE